MHHAEFRDRRLVEVYDAECPWGRDDDVFLGVMGASPVRVLDLGCGTGRLALGAAAVGHAVTGIDPARASLDAAKVKAGAERVTWIEGTSAAAATGAFDVAVMTSHVAQVFVADDEWHRTLADLHRALVAGGVLTFDARDPRAREWEQWNPVDSRREITLPDGDVVVVCTEVTELVARDVTFVRRYTFPDGDTLDSEATLVFRTEDELREGLRAAGFTVEAIYGGWRHEPVGAGDGELLVIARA